MMSVLPPQVPWRRFVCVLRKLGYTAQNTKHGSARSFRNPGRIPNVVSFREPHPGRNMRQRMLHEYLRKLLLAPDEYVWRERISRRLVTEATKRQVIVFTHDLLFLRALLDESRRQDVQCEKQYVRREGQAGLCSPDLPWIAMPVKERIGKLRVRWQAADKIHRISGPDAYEGDARDIYGMLREARDKR